MENWKQERCNEIDRALERIQRRVDRVVQVLNSLYDEGQQQQQQQQPQQQQQQQQQQQLSSQQQQQQDQQRQRQRQRRRQKQQQVSILTSELARLQDMNDRLFDFRDRLCFYSNLGYVESLNEWQYEIQKICVKAEGFAQCSHHNHHHHRNNHKHHRQDRQHSTGRVRNDSGQGCFRPLVPLMN